MEWLTWIEEITVTVTPYVEWLRSTATVLVTVTPNLGGLSPMMILSGFWLIMTGWQFLNDGRVI